MRSKKQMLKEISLLSDFCRDNNLLILTYPPKNLKGDILEYLDFRINKYKVEIKKRGYKY